MHSLSQNESSVLCCVRFYREQCSANVTSFGSSCQTLWYDGDAAAELWRCLHVCMCVLFVSVHHDVTVV